MGRAKGAHFSMRALAKPINHWAAMTSMGFAKKRAYDALFFCSTHPTRALPESKSLLLRRRRLLLRLLFRLGFWLARRLFRQRLSGNRGRGRRWRLCWRRGSFAVGEPQIIDRVLDGMQAWTGS